MTMRHHRSDQVMQGGIDYVRQWLAWLTRGRRFWRPDWKPAYLRRAGFDPHDVADPKAQMEFVARVDFEPRRLLNKSEYKILLILEAVAREINAGLRVMAQTSMGEIIKPKKDRRQIRIATLLIAQSIASELISW
jgi:hypothetical protein